MKKTQVFALAAVLAAGLLAGLMLSGVAFNSAHAQQPDRLAAEKWEYCAITDVPAFGRDGKVVSSAKVCYFEGSGCRREDIEATLSGNDFGEGKKAALAKAMAKLGAEGWELLGEATQFGFYHDNVDPKALYFRRRLK
jgi:hypothetical protein